jgi:hypothetical protein
MITGLNTNVKYSDIVYHVQTEDKGVNNPLIESLIYVKGAIVDSHRTPYRHLLQSETFRDSILQKILDYQHRQIVSAIKKGRFQKGMDLQPYVDGKFIFEFSSSKKLNDPDSLDRDHLFERENAQKAVDLPITQRVAENKVVEDSEAPISSGRMQSLQSTEQWLSPNHDLVSSPFPIKNSDPTASWQLPTEQGIEIRVESSRNFVAGSHVELKLYIESRQSKTRLENVQVVIKVIGTSLSPRLYSGKTDKFGSLRVSFTLPSYSVGSAALIIQASTGLGNQEIKYLIRKK